MCDSKGEVISVGKKYEYGDPLDGAASQAYARKITYGVKKGKTYYLRIVGYADKYTDSEGKYYALVKWTNTKVKAAKSGTKKSKAKLIKRKKTIKGLVTAGDKKAKWYKITTKKSPVNITVKTTNVNESLKVTVYMRKYGHKGKWKSTTYTGTRNGQVAGPLYNFNHTKWTIYVKVQRAAKSSGYYTIKWK